MSADGMIAPAETAEQVLDLLTSRGGESYFGEPVTVLEHSLQAAYFAKAAQSPDASDSGCVAARCRSPVAF